MPSESEIHDLLTRFGPNIIDLLDSVDFWDIEGEYNPVELISELKQQPEYKRYVAESQKKNSQVWDIVKGLFVGTAILAGISQVKRDYKPQLARQVAKEASQPKADRPKHLTSQDYQNQYIREHGGEFITRMSKADQQQLVRFLWKNKGQHERPLAKNILKNEPTLAYLVDNKEYRLRAIKRTEIGRAAKYGAWQYAKDWSFTTKTRHSAFRPTSRPSHKALSGETAPIDKPYSNGEQFCKENSINCLCWDTFGTDLSKVTKDPAKQYADNMAEIEKNEKAKLEPVKVSKKPVSVSIKRPIVEEKIKTEEVKLSPQRELQNAKTSEDMQKWAEKHHPGIEWNLKEGDPKMMRQVLTTFDTVSKDFPQIKKNLSFVGFSPQVSEHAWMTSEKIDYKDGHVETKLHLSTRMINPKKFLDDMELAKRYNAHPAGTCDAKGRTAHECGHLLDFALMSDKKAAMKIKSFKEKTAVDKSLSLYSMQSKDEAWAEAFAENYFGTAKHHAYTDSQYDLFKEMNLT